MTLDHFDHRLRLANGSHQLGSGKGRAMNVISYINGDRQMTDFPARSARPLASFVQSCSDLLAGPDGYLSPEDSLHALELGWQTLGTADVAETVTHAWVAELLACHIVALTRSAIRSWRHLASLANPRQASLSQPDQVAGSAAGWQTESEKLPHPRGPRRQSHRSTPSLQQGPGSQRIFQPVTSRPAGVDKRGLSCVRRWILDTSVYAVEREGKGHNYQPVRHRSGAAPKLNIAAGLRISRIMSSAVRLLESNAVRGSS
jgi:hypothetical protein